MRAVVAPERVAGGVSLMTAFIGERARHLEEGAQHGLGLEVYSLRKL